VESDCKTKSMRVHGKNLPNDSNLFCVFRSVDLLETISAGLFEHETIETPEPEKILKTESVQDFTKGND